MVSNTQYAWRAPVLLALTLVLFGCGPGRGTQDVSNVPSSTTPTTDGTANRAPVALTDTASISGTSVDLDILANDSDPDGDPITITGTTAPANGSVQIMNNGTSSPADDFIRYTPNPGYFGPDSFSYTIYDGLDGTANGDVLLTLTPAAAGTPLIAIDDSGTTIAGSAKRLAVLDNDSGGNGNPLKIVSIAAANYGSAVRSDNGTAADPTDDYIMYVPDPGYSGADTFTYSVTDGDTVATAAINIIVVPPIPATPPSNPPPAPPTPGFIGGRVMKGPVSNAIIQIFPIKADGLPASSLPVAQSVTDADGNWSILDPLPGQHRLIAAKGGSFIDEAHSFDNPATRRFITLPDSSTLEGIMPAAADYLALTVYTNALLLKSRSETTDGNFVDVYDNNRTSWATAFGFDLVATAPASPIDPDPSATTAGRQYALAAGGAANALNTLGAGLGIVVPRPDTIQALVRDLTACDLDGQDMDGVISVNVSGVPTAISTNNDLNLEILRYRNNQFSKFGNTPLPVISIDDCAVTGVLPDTTAPVISGGTPALNVANTVPSGTPLSDPVIQTLLLSIVAEDNRDGVVTVSNDAPAELPIGETVINFTTTDSTGNTAFYATTVNVVTGNTTPDVTPIGALVSVQGTPFSADLSFFFSDADGDALTYIVDGLPPSMSLNETTGIITGTPTNYDAIIAPFTVTATASDGVLTATDTFTFGVVNTDDAPVLFSPIADQVASLGTALSLNPGDNFYDADGHTLSFSVSGLPATSGLVFDSLTGSLSGTPIDADESASPLTISVTASDGINAVSDTFILTVLNDNKAPTVLSPLGTRLATEDAPFFFDTSTAFDDPDGDSLNFSASGLPASLSLDNATGVISGTPTNNDAMTTPFVISVSASDGGLSVSDTLTINVININDAPVLVTPIGLQFAAQDVLFTSNVSTNFDDIDNDALTFSATGLPDTLSIDSVTGIISGTPDGTAVASSPLTVTVTASDGSASVSDTFSLNVSLMNIAPVLVAPIGAQSGVQGSVLSINLANYFSDPNGNSLSFSLGGLPTGSGLTLDTVTGLLSGTPNNVDVTASPIVLIATASDGALNVSENFVLMITNVNDAPTVVTPITAPPATQDSPFTMDVSGNFEDIDGQSLSFAASGLPPSLSIDPVTGIISGTPVNADVLASPIGVTITASDGTLSVNSSFLLTVINVNDAPTLDTPIAPGPASQGSPFSLNLNSSFSDPDNDTLSYTIVGLPSGTGLTLDSVAGFLAGTPTNNDWLASPLTLTVTASDGSLSVNDTFALSVSNVNDTPVLVTPISPPAASQGALYTLDVSDNFDDPDGDALSFSATGLPATLTIDPVTGIISGTPTYADALASPFAVNVNASDGTLDVGGSFSLTIIRVNEAPTTVGIIDVAVQENAAPTVIDLFAAFEDTEDADSALSYTVVGNTNTGLFSSVDIDGGLGTLTISYAADTPGASTLTVRATDTDADFIETTFTVAVNDTPTTSGIGDVTVLEDAAPTVIDLFAAFDDTEDADTALTYAVVGNTDSSLFSSLPVDGGAGTLTLNYAADTNGASTLTVRATDTSGGFAEAVFDVAVNAQADLSIASFAPGTTSPGIGQEVDFTLVLSNSGPSTATDVTVSVPLPAGYTYVTANNPGEYNPTTGDWYRSAINGTSTLVLTVIPGATGPYDITAEVAAVNEPDPDSTPANANPAEDDQRTASTTPLPVTDLSLTVSASDPIPAPGAALVLTIDLVNFGPNNATGISVALPPLPGELTWESASPSTGSFDLLTGVWDAFGIGWSGDPMAPLSATLTVNARVDIDVPETTVLEPVVTLTGLDQVEADTNEEDSVPLLVLGDGVGHEWVGGTAPDPFDWHDPDNWDTGIVPSPGDDVTIPPTPWDPELNNNVLDLATLDIEAGALLSLNGFTLSTVGELDARTGPVVGPGTVELHFGKLRGTVPDLVIQAATPTTEVEFSGDVTINGDFTISQGYIDTNDQTVNVTGNLLSTGTGLLVQKGAASEVIVDGDVRFEGGDYTQEIGKKFPLSAGELRVRGNFEQAGNQYSFAAEKNHLVIFDGSGPQSITFQNPDESNPDSDEPALSGSRFANLLIEKDAETNGALTLLSDVVVLRTFEEPIGGIPRLVAAPGSGFRLSVGGMDIDTPAFPETERIIFDNVPLRVFQGDALAHMEGLVFTNMNPSDVQLYFERTGFGGPNDLVGARFETLPDFVAGGRYIVLDNIHPDPGKNLTLEVLQSVPAYGLPMTETIGNATIMWGTGAEDSDRDGILDSDEYVFGTNPVFVDSDGDGADDPTELSAGTDPFDNDSDGDGIGDGVELTVGSDANAAEAPGTVLYVRPAPFGNDANSGFGGWNDALATNIAVAAALVDGIGAGQPFYVLYDAGVYAPLEIDAHNFVSVVGSVGPGQPVPSTLPTTLFDASSTPDVAVVRVIDSSGISMQSISLTGASNFGGGDGSVGGGIYVNDASSVTLSDMVIEDNIAADAGGGVYVEAGGATIIKNSLIRRNVVPNGGIGGGGIAAYGTLTLSGSIIADNRYDGNSSGGGGLYLEVADGPMTLRDNMILANYSKTSGGGIFLFDVNAPVTLFNNLLAGNATKDDFGGGLYADRLNRGATTLIESNTVVFNRALLNENAAGGVHIDRANDAQLRDNIIWHNVGEETGDNLQYQYVDDSGGGGALIEHNSFEDFGAGDGNSNNGSNPRFEFGFYLRDDSGVDDTGSRTAAAAGLDAPYTTATDGSEDTGTVDRGFHYGTAANGTPYAINLVGEVAECSTDTLTLSLTITGQGGELGPGHVVAVRADTSDSAGGTLVTRTGIRPYGWANAKLAIDEGDGVYRFAINGVSHNPGEIAVYEVEIDDDVRLEISSSDLNALFASEGC